MSEGNPITEMIGVIESLSELVVTIEGDINNGVIRITEVSQLVSGVGSFMKETAVFLRSIQEVFDQNQVEVTS